MTWLEQIKIKSIIRDKVQSLVISDQIYPEFKLPKFKPKADVPCCLISIAAGIVPKAIRIKLCHGRSKWKWQETCGIQFQDLRSHAPARGTRKVSIKN